jgi:5-hydroxyisourate hydrolase-like protein (transthyretin family)
VNAAGTGFGANEAVSLRWNAAGGAVLGTAATDASGSFSAATVTIPATATIGGHAIVAVGSSSGRQAAASFTVTATAVSVGSGALSGKVVNAASGNPVRGAEVVLRQRATIAPLAEPEDPVVLRTTTDADGEYSFSAAETGIYQLRVSQDGYHSTTVSNILILAGQSAVVNVALRADAPLRAMGRVTGTVSDTATGEAIRRALVVAMMDGTPGSGPGRVFGLARTNADGKFTVSGLRAGTYKLLVLAKGYLPREATGVQVQATETAASEVRLTANPSQDSDARSRGRGTRHFLDDDGDEGDDRDGPRGEGKGNDRGRGNGHGRHDD